MPQICIYYYYIQREDITTLIRGKKEILYTLKSFCFFDFTKMTYIISWYSS